MAVVDSDAVRARAAAASAAERVAERTDLDEDRRDEICARLEGVAADLWRALRQVYGGTHDIGELFDRLVELAVAAAAVRPARLRRLDRRREIDQAWFLRERMIGYVCYADRFAGRLGEVADHLDYLGELGVTYLHLMPLLSAREGENDGGYAVADYREVDPRLGRLADLTALSQDLHARGMSLCVDVVLNHTAREHAWARAAMAGDETYRRFYHVFADRRLPDAYSTTLWEVFPDTAPGSFSCVEEMGGWVWTTFHDYQWDLNWANPDVLAAMSETILFLANAGVDVFRLDAVPFLWKRIGTDCQNQPEAHALLQALRAVLRVAAPAVVFKAEAIVAPDQLVPYLGAHQTYVPECDLAYHNQLMVMLWSSLASRDVRLMTQSLRRMTPPPQQTSWVTYVRCHDDIGWAVSDADAHAVGLDPRAHRRFLVDFFAGRHPGSFARGALFQENPVTGDARTCGAAAALTGIELAMRQGDAAGLQAGIRRLLLLYSVTYSFGGIPLVYSGDELGLGNDTSYLADPGLAEDNRWMHRPFMDWERAGRRHLEGSVEGRIFAGLVQMGQARRDLPALRGGGVSEALWTDDPHVFAYHRKHPASGDFLALANFSDDPQSCHTSVLAAAGVPEPQTALSSDGPVSIAGDRVLLEPWGFVWLTPRPG